MGILGEVSTSVRAGGGAPAPVEKAPAATSRRGHGHPRRGVNVSSRWGWGPSASGKSACGHISARTWASSARCQRQFAAGVGPRRQWKKRLRPHLAEDMDILGEVSASVRAGGGAPAPVEKSQRLRPHLAEDMDILGEVSASVRAGCGAPAPVEKSQSTHSEFLKMRLIAGSLKGRRLKTPTWEELRPTSDKLRETLFNVVAPRIRGARVLDGYAGTGALGIEAISRGAAQVTFVERDRRAQDLIAANLAHCGIAGGYVIIRGSFVRALSDLDGVWFDLVLLDPPYDQPADEPIAAAGRCLAPDGLLVLEHARRVAAPASAGMLVRTRQLISGDCALSI